MTGAVASFEYARGVMALRGRRYLEAEEIFAALLKDHPSTPAWCGLGAAKTGLLDGLSPRGIAQLCQRPEVFRPRVLMVEPEHYLSVTPPTTCVRAPQVSSL